MLLSEFDLSETAASCEGIVRIYFTATGEVHALKGIDARFPSGCVTAVVGGSGSGKSSLLRVLSLIDRPTAGKVSIGNTDVTTASAGERRRLRRERIGYLFQRPSDNLIPYLTARQQLDIAARTRSREADTYRPALEMLELVGLAARGDHRPEQLSGGEQQRLAVVSAVIGEPAIVLADEPTAELDSASGRAVTDLMMSLAHKGTAFIVATHDHQVTEAADRTLHLRHGTLEAESDDDGMVSVIDGSGRIQLPPAALECFPTGRAVVRLDESGDGVRIVPP